MLISCLLASAATGAAGRAPPVPFSTSNSDGLPTEGNWATFSELIDRVKTEPEQVQQRADLIQYAADRVADELQDIAANLRSFDFDGFDAVWPGDGCNGVAYGGLHETLKHLERAGVSRIGKRMGADGGSASTIFSMADSDLFLKLYQVWELFFDGRPDRVAAEAARDTGVSAAMYAEAIRDDDAFARAQRDAFIVTSCTEGKNTIFHGFQTREQLVAAGYAAGDESLGGVTIGTIVDGADVGHCMDGGEVTVFPLAAATPNHAVLVYNTPWIATTHPTKDSIDTLWRLGVDNAIATLKSPQLAASMGDGNMAVALPGPDGIVTESEFAKIRDVADGTTDVDLSGAVEVV